MAADDEGAGGRPEPDRAASILLSVAATDDAAVHRQFDQFFYPFVLAFVRKRNSRLADQAATKFGAGTVPRVAPADLDAVAHDAVVAGLRRARRSAFRFDASKGNAFDWVLRAAIYAYRDVVLDHLGVRRKFSVEPMDDESLALAQGPLAAPEDPAERVVDRVAVQAALERLPPPEQEILVLRFRFEFTEREIAEQMFGSASTIAVYQVRQLLLRAEARLAETLREDFAPRVERNG